MSCMFAVAIGIFSFFGIAQSLSYIVAFDSFPAVCIVQEFFRRTLCMYVLGSNNQCVRDLTPPPPLLSPSLFICSQEWSSTWQLALPTLRLTMTSIRCLSVTLCL